MYTQNLTQLFGLFFMTFDKVPQGGPMEEEWAVIPEFPNYEISTSGNIYNIRFDRIMRVSQTQAGNAKVALVNDRGRFTRGVGVLVAEAFLERPNHLCDQVICKDGNFRNQHVTNLAWRPFWFTWKYTRQIKSLQPDHYKNLSVENLLTGAVYDSIIECGMTEGLLFDDIWRSTYTGEEVFPDHCRYAIVERV